MIKRRDFILATGAVTAAVGVGLATPAIAKGKRELKLVTTWPKNFPGLGTGAQRFADRVTAGTDGQITVKLFSAGELVPPFEAFDAVSSGSADMYHAAEYYWQGKSKAFNFFAGVPLGMMAPEFNAWVYYGGGQALWDELAADFNLKVLLCGNTGPQMGGWFKKEINTIGDLKGLKIRMPGLGGEVMRQVGAAAVSLPGGEIFTSLQSGAIDATEFVGPWNDLALGFYKVAKNYYYPGFHEPGTANGLGINKAVWESFTKSEKAIIEHAAMATNSDMLAEFNANNGRALKTLTDKHHVVLRRFPEKVWTHLAEVSNDVLSATSKEGGIVTKVAKSYLGFRDNVAGWTKLSSQAYADSRDKALYSKN